MNEKVLKYLYDIKLAVDEIESFFEGKKKYFAAYTSDILLKRAIERNLEIIGEAMNIILKEDPSFHLDNSRKIIGLRNQIIHGYDNISNENIWGIIINHLPNLKQEVEKLIEGEK